MRKYVVIYEKIDGNYSAYVPDLPGCVAAADTKNQTESLIKDAIELYIEQLKVEGQPIPEPTTKAGQVTVSA